MNDVVIKCSSRLFALAKRLAEPIDSFEPVDGLLNDEAVFKHVGTDRVYVVADLEEMQSQVDTYRKLCVENDLEEVEQALRNCGLLGAGGIYKVLDTAEGVLEELYEARSVATFETFTGERMSVCRSSPWIEFDPVDDYDDRLYLIDAYILLIGCGFLDEDITFERFAAAVHANDFYFEDDSYSPIKWSVVEKIRPYLTK
jgi:hypothetical protein